MLLRVIVYLRFNLVNHLSCSVPRPSIPCDYERRAQTLAVAKQAILSCRKLVGKSSCLVEALALHLMLRRRSINSEIILGAKLDQWKKFQAHAWLEMDGETTFGLDPQNSFQRFR